VFWLGNRLEKKKIATFANIGPTKRAAGFSEQKAKNGGSEIAHIT